MTSKPVPFPSFEEFFAELHGGNAPYGWQSQLASQVGLDGWPASVEVPTGLGKTTTIAIAVYDLARELHDQVGKRRAPQRIFHVVNRQVLVDDTHSYVARIADAINHAEATRVLHPVREALRKLLPESADDREPVVLHAAIHGGAVSDNHWLRARGCTVVSLTPHQLVSRLVMRGFGVTPATRSIHAGLVGVDRLVLFDEPHLTAPAYMTIRDAERLQSQATVDLGVPIGATVLLGATVPQALLDDADGDRRWSIDMAAPEVQSRVRAPKTLKRVTVKSASDDAFVTALSREALKASADGASSVAVFANTIDVAQQTYLSLREHLQGRADAPRLRLVTSRFRSLDRQPLPSEPDGITVTTQCLEVGVDISFNALITEATSWDALVQRLGRLNRDGSETPTPAVLVTAASGALRKGTEAVYGKEPVRALLEGLNRRFDEAPDGVDVSGAGLASLYDESFAVQLPRAGTLHSGLIPLMTFTRPVVSPDIPVDALITGPDERPRREVRVAWRQVPSAVLHSRASAVSAGEYVSVPIGAWRSFVLTGGSGTELVADVSVAVDDDDRKITFKPLWDRGEVWVWSLRDERWQQVTQRGHLDLGESFVISTSLGGYQRELGWTGRASQEGQPEVNDLSLAAALSTRISQLQGQETIPVSEFEWIISPATLVAALEYMGPLSSEDRQELDACVRGLSEAWTTQVTGDGDADDIALLEESLRVVAKKLATVVHRLAGVRHRAPVVRFDVDTIHAGRVVLRWAPQSSTTSANEETPVTLVAHSAQVGQWAELDAVAAGLTPELAEKLRRAGLLHDVGKRTPGYQKILAQDANYEASEDNASSPLLAKSLSGALSSRSRAAEQRLRRMALVPVGWRHELVSAEAARRDGQCALVTHLVGSHHGWWRPCMPAVAGQAEGFAHADTYLELNQAYGPWGLAYLEALLRLADWRASAFPLEVDSRAQRDAQRAIFTSPDPVAGVVEVETTSRDLVGLLSHPTTGWFAAVGLLAAAADRGDSVARLCWRAVTEDPADMPVLPVLTSSDSLEALVAHVYESHVWNQADRLIAEHTLTSDGLRIKSQKVEFADSLRGLLVAGDLEQAAFLLGLAGDLAEASISKKGSRQQELHIPVFANNSSYPGVALDLVRKGGSQAAGVTVEALSNPHKGYAKNQCDGGLDRLAASAYAITGVGSADGAGPMRVSRTSLAPLVMYGIAALGNTGASYLGFGRREGRRSLRLPLPECPVHFAELRAQVLSVRSADKWDWNLIGVDAVLEATLIQKGKSEMYWDTGGLRRSQDR